MASELLDMIIVGAGLSGIGAAWHLQSLCPGKSYAILEAREHLGGTWDLFRYPGIRSDSDMYTLGYNFKPWVNPKSIADGPSIRAYIEETARENGIDRRIRYGQRVVSAAWSSEHAYWTLEVQTVSSGAIHELRARFLQMCTGYYNYAQGYTPEFPGRKKFKGTFIHPQHWPEDLDYSGKSIVVIGSGATAVTLVPALTDKAAHVTMLQRSPTYVATVPSQDAISNRLRKFLPEKLVYHMARTRNVGLQMLVYRLSKEKPQVVRRLLLMQARCQLGKHVDMRHFSPHYNPWDERLCAVPDGDLFKVLRSGRASVVTDQIETLNARGITLKSGQTLEADIIVSATGLDLQLMGGTKLVIDGKAVDMSSTMNYKGMMFSDIPNLAMVFGYTNASWTLKADLTSEYICRLIKHMDKVGMRQCTPRNHDPEVVAVPFLDLASGYIQRAMEKFPKQGNKAPWKLYQNYVKDLANLRFASVEDGVMEFSHPVHRQQHQRDRVTA